MTAGGTKGSPRAREPPKEKREHAPSNEQSASDLSGSGGAAGTITGGVGTLEVQALSTPQGKEAETPAGHANNQETASPGAGLVQSLASRHEWELIGTNKESFVTESNIADL